MQKWWEEYEFKEEFTEEELTLFERYGLSRDQRLVYAITRAAKNMPDIVKGRAEELVWCIGVAAFDHRGDMRFYVRSVEDRMRKLEEAERRFGFFSREWDKDLMRMLVIMWSEGLLVVDPDLMKDGRLYQWVHEYFGPNYPEKALQTEEWKKQMQDMYVLMTRSILRSYPQACMGGIVSFSEMKDFDWDKYDMDSKRRNGDITSVIPHGKLVRMISVHPGEKMREFLAEMGPVMLKKWGVRAYDTFDDALEGENLRSDDIPTFVGGSRRVDIFRCLSSLFQNEPRAFSLMKETYSELQASGALPCPPHMEMRE